MQCNSSAILRETNNSLHLSGKSGGDFAQICGMSKNPCGVYVLRKYASITRAQFGNINSEMFNLLVNNKEANFEIALL